MNKLCITVCTLAGGFVAGYLSSGLGIMISMLVSGVGSMVGVYLGWKLARWIER